MSRQYTKTENLTKGNLHYLRWCVFRHGDHQLVKRYGMDDYLSEASAGLVDAMNNYRDGTGASFTTFATKCIANRISRLNSHLRCRKISGVSYEPMKEIRRYAVDADSKPCDIAVGNELHSIYTDAIEWLGKMMEARDCHIIKQILKGRTLDSIGRDPEVADGRISRERVRQIHDRALVRARTLLFRYCREKNLNFINTFSCVGG